MHYHLSSFSPLLISKRKSSLEKAKRKLFREIKLQENIEKQFDMDFCYLNVIFHAESIFIFKYTIQITENNNFVVGFQIKKKQKPIRNHQN